MPKKPRKKGLLQGVFFSLLFLLLLLLALFGLFRQDFPWDMLWETPYWVFLIGFCAYTIMFFLESIKLRGILNQLHQRIKFLPALFNSVGGYLFTSITPMAAGGQPFQISHLRAQGIPLSHSITIIMGRISQHVLLSFLTVFLGIPFFYDYLFQGSFLTRGALSLGLGVSFFSALAILFLLFQAPGVFRFIRSLIGKIFRKGLRRRFLAHWSMQKPILLQIQSSMKELWGKNPLFMLWDSFFSWLISVIQALSLWSVLYFMGLNPDPLLIVYLYFLLGLLVFYIPTPGASGSLELSFAALMGGSDFLNYLAAMLVWRMGSYYLHLIIASFLIPLFWKNQFSSAQG